VLAVVSLASCSVYRQGQTPDDVYYSPGREKESYAVVEKRDNNRYSQQEDDYYNSEDNYLRMRVRDRYRWSSFDNYAYMNDWQYGGGYYPSMYSGMYYSPYGYAYTNPFMFGGIGGMWGGPYMGFNSYWNSYYAWNNFYNPYCPGMIVVSPKTNPVAYSNVRNFRMSSYTNNNYSNRNTASGNRLMNSYRSTTPNARYNNSNSYYNTQSGTNRSVGGSLRKVFSGGNNNNNSYYDGGSSNTPTRTYNPSPSRSTYSPSSSGGSSGGSRGGGGGGVGSSNGRSGRGG
jgi:hypothetical protein